MKKELEGQNIDPTEGCMNLVDGKAEQAHAVIVDLINDFFSQRNADESMMALRIEYHKVQMFMEIVENILCQICAQCAEWNDWYETELAKRCGEKTT